MHTRTNARTTILAMSSVEKWKWHWNLCTYEKNSPLEEKQIATMIRSEIPTKYIYHFKFFPEIDQEICGSLFWRYVYIFISWLYRIWRCGWTFWLVRLFHMKLIFFSLLYTTHFSPFVFGMNFRLIFFRLNSGCN